MSGCFFSETRCIPSVPTMPSTYQPSDTASKPAEAKNASSTPTSFYQTFASIWKLRVSTALHRMPTRSSDDNSVRLSDKRVDSDKTEERSVQIFIPYERSFSLVF